MFFWLQKMMKRDPRKSKNDRLSKIAAGLIQPPCEKKSDELSYSHSLMNLRPSTPTCPYTRAPSLHRRVNQFVSRSQTAANLLSFHAIPSMDDLTRT